MLRNITETRKSKRRRNLSPDNLSSGDVQQLASQTKSRSLLSLLSTGGHGGRLWAESNPSQEWRLAGAPSEVSCAPHGAASTSLGTPPERQPPPPLQPPPPPLQASIGADSTSPLSSPFCRPVSTGVNHHVNKSPQSDPASGRTVTTAPPNTTPPNSSAAAYTEKKQTSPANSRDLKPSDKLKGNRILDIGKIQKAVCEHMLCKKCVEKRENTLLTKFAAYIDSLDEETRGNKSTSDLLKEYKQSDEMKKIVCRGELCISNETQYGIATSIAFSCVPSSDKRSKEVHDCGKVEAETSKYHEKSVDGKQSGHAANWWFALNIKMVLAMQSIGKGGKAAGNILAFLDLPRSKSFATRTFGAVESVIGKAQRDLSDRLIAEALKNEIIAQMKKDKFEISYDEWIALPPDERETILLTISFDMGWQKRSSGRRYDSLSGHAFAIGGLTKKVIACEVVCKHCQLCETRKAAGKEKDEAHECPANYVGSSKGMESWAAVKMIREGYVHQNGFTVGAVCMDDDSTTKSQLRHRWSDKINEGTMSENEWPRTASGSKKQDKGKLDLHMCVPEILADPTHRKKVVVNALYALKDRTKSKPINERCTDRDILKINTYWGFMVKQNATKPFDELVTASKAVVEHHFNNHEFCGQWCPVKRGSNGVRRTCYRCKETHGKLYESITQTIAPYITEDRLKELHHSFSTQGNEAMNTSVASYAPKTATFSTTMSLHNRVKMASSINIVGHTKYWNLMYEELEMDMPAETGEYIKSLQNIKTRSKVRREQTHTKLKRQEKFYEKLKKAIAADERARRKGMGTYATGAGFHDASDNNEFKGGDTTADKNKDQQQPCIDCGEYNHKTSRSKKCEKNGSYDQTTAAKRCPNCNRRGHSSSRSKICPEHPTANLPANNVSTVTTPVDGSTELASNRPLVSAELTEQIVEKIFVQSEESSSSTMTTSAQCASVFNQVVNTASTSLSMRLDTEFSGTESAHQGNIGTSTERRVESENHDDVIILDSVEELVLDAEFIDQLDFDGDSIDTNPPDLHDLDVDLE